MSEVRTGECYCPKLEEMNFKPCLNPPTTSYLVDGLVNMINNNNSYENEREAERFKRLSTFIARHPPEKSWLLGLLSTLVPDNEIFNKGWLPPKKVKAEVEARMIDNHDGFFDGLNPLSSK